MFGGNAPLSDDRLRVVNFYSDEPLAGACNACGGNLHAEAYRRASAERQQTRVTLESAFASIPVVSIHSPLDWDYSAVMIVTGQSTTGTGPWSEVTSAFSDLFGSQSKVYNQKIAAGEELCKNALRAKALALGCNAIVAADIDYAEVGGARAMLMVCMTGTAIRLRNVEVLGEDAMERLQNLAKLYERLVQLDALQLDENPPNFMPQ